MLSPLPLPRAGTSSSLPLTPNTTRSAPAPGSKVKSSRSVQTAEDKTPLPLQSGKEETSVTSSVLQVLVGRQSQSHTQSQHTTTTHYTKTHLLQIRLDQLQTEVRHLETQSEQLEKRIKFFLGQHLSITSATDQLDLKLDSLARSHKSLSAQMVGR
nr:uncharacterized protein LOC128702300 [Cherax quadricarinatus]